MPTLRVGFAGTPVFAARALAAIVDAGFDVPLVLTQPDRPKGRGLKTEASPVKTLASAHGLPLLQPATLRTEAREEALRVPLDVLVVAAYGLLLPTAVLDWPRHGCINIHASLLPRWRGAAPIQRALLAGDECTGVTLMQMDAGLDTGPMIDAVRVPVAPRETAGTLHDKLAAAGATAAVAVLARLAREGRVDAIAQPEHGVTYAAKIGREDAAIDWRDTAVVVDRLVRAFDPVPGAHSTLGGATLKIWGAEPIDAVHAQATPGTILAANADGLVVACGTGSLRVRELQPAGGKRMRAAAFIAGRDALTGARFDVAAIDAGPAYARRAD